MPILAPLKPFFDGMVVGGNSRDDRPAAERRAEMHAMIDVSFSAMGTEHAPLPIERDYPIAVEGGEIILRLYSPATGTAPLPCHIYYHSGGFWLGTIDQADSMCRALAADVGCAVVSVGYRLAPEHKFPTAPEDCYAALLWVADHSGDIGIDRARISIGGASAGGNLAAVVALMARDRGGPPLVYQVLEIPLTDFTNIEPLVVPDEGVTLRSSKEQMIEYYFSEASEISNPYASPLLASDLTRLPNAFIACAEYDQLCAEGKAFARRLDEAGVAVEFRCWEGQFHGSQYMTALIPVEASAYQAAIVQALKRAFDIPL